MHSRPARVVAGIDQARAFLRARATDVAAVEADTADPCTKARVTALFNQLTQTEARSMLYLALWALGDDQTARRTP